MSDRLAGIHHVTAIATDPQRNFDFYGALLGLRLVKRTVNFDDPGTYHLYYGDERGRPGTLLTFFPWPGARRGRAGTSQVTTTALAVPEGSLEAWSRRLSAARVPHEAPQVRFERRRLRLRDPDGMRLELVESEGAASLAPWSDGPLPADHAIRGIDGVTLSVPRLEPTAELLSGSFGAIPAGSDGAHFRFELHATVVGRFLDVVERPEEGPAAGGAGSVHHVAFRAADDEEQESWRRDLVTSGLRVTPMQDRRYFHSIYFREPGGVLFEIATDPPGFGYDESPDRLGTELKLPPWLEAERSAIEDRLPRLENLAPIAANSTALR